MKASPSVGDPTTREQRDRALFDRIAANYAAKDLRHSSREPRRQRLERTVRQCGGHLGHLLEVGCGVGFAAEYLAGGYESYTGVDHSAELVHFAKQYNGGENRTFECASITDFAPQRTFDSILMIGVLHHLSEPVSVLKQLATLLSAEGSLFINEPQRGNPALSLLRLLRKELDPDYSRDQVEFSEIELRRLFEHAGLSVEISPQGVLSTPFAEARVLPEAIWRPLARAATALDPWLEARLEGTWGRRLAWNLVAVARPTRAGRSNG